MATVRSMFKSVLANSWVLLVLRLGLGGTFVVSSATKLQAQAEFTQKVLSYNMLPEIVARPFAGVLPFVELFLGCCLLLGVFIRFTSALSIPLVLSFTIANLYAIVRHVGEFHCGCLGDLVNLSHSASLAIDVAMMMVAAILLVHSSKAERLGLAALLGRKSFNLEKGASIVLKIGLVALAMVVSIAFIGVQPTLKEMEIDQGLKEGKVVLLLIYQGDAEQSMEQRTIVANLEVLYSHDVVVVRHSLGSDPVLDRRFPAEGPATLMIITGESLSTYVVRYRFEGMFDAKAIEAALIESIDTNTP